MPNFKIPFHKTNLTLEIPDSISVNVLKSRLDDYQPAASETRLIDQALDQPVDSLSLESLSQNKYNIVIITSDHTRPLPSHLTLPRLLERIRRGNPAAQIKILVATGSHRPPSRNELVSMMGESVVQTETLLMHDCHDPENLSYLGTLPSGGELWVNKEASEADLLIAEGFIEPHFFAGFSGGRKSVLPGIAGYQTVLANHCSTFIAHPNAKSGILDGNPLHKDMLYAARQLNLQFILNLILNQDKKIISAVSGDSEKAHSKGCRFLNRYCRVPAAPADIVISSNNGYPLDQNIYQSVKAMNTAAATAKPGAVLIVAASCADGHGGEGFYRSMAEADSPEQVLKAVLRTPQNETVPDQWQFQILARVLKEHRVILVTDQCDPQVILDMHIDHAFSMSEALRKAQRIKGADADITVIPDGVGVIVEQNPDGR
ncbi:MAG: nickel-dependent lactate racemase [candidate division KSB1 bacterium]|nr:nickel-dependent lactate racemase [candidate division KSB1 bacterium]